MLTIDIGNSRIKWALFQSGEVVEHNCLDYKAESLGETLSKAGLPLKSHKLAVSNVAGEGVKRRLISWLKENTCEDYWFAETRLSQCNIVNSYDVASDLGVDRWLAMIGAYNRVSRHKDEAICVIDCGTAITLDVVDQKGKHVGGLIMPGFQTMYKSLVSEASDIQQNNDCVNIASAGQGLESSTDAAVNQGCAQLIVEGLSVIAERQKKSVGGKLRCVVTGGDGKWVAKSLKILNTYEPFLVQQGLYFAALNDSQ